MTFFEKLYYLNRHDRRGLLVALTVIAVVSVLFFLVPDGESVDPGESGLSGNLESSRISGSSASSAPKYYAQPERAVERFVFDPNTADSTQLLRLGLQPWMVRNIYKYRAAGGVYRTKEDFARLYGLTAKQYRELEPYIRISADYQPASTVVRREQNIERDTLRRFPEKLTKGETIDLNAGDTTLYKKVPGIGSYYARKINEYRNKLGGFVSVDQLDEIADFPQEAKAYFALTKTSPAKIRINLLSLNELRRHPYISYAQARAIVDYRRLSGAIHSLQELSLLPEFSAGAIARLEPYINYDKK